MEALKSNLDFTELKNVVLYSCIESGNKLENWTNWSQDHDGNKYSTYI